MGFYRAIFGNVALPICIRLLSSLGVLVTWEVWEASRLVRKVCSLVSCWFSTGGSSNSCTLGTWTPATWPPARRQWTWGGCFAVGVDVFGRYVLKFWPLYTRPFLEFVFQFSERQIQVQKMFGKNWEDTNTVCVCSCF